MQEPLHTAPATGQPPAVLSAWVEEQLRELQSTTLQRVAQARDRLDSAQFDWNGAEMEHAVEVFRDEAERLPFEPLVRRNVMDLLLGRNMNARAEFVQQYHRVVGSGNLARQHFGDLAKRYPTHTAGARRLLVELDFERQELDRSISQALEWLGEVTATVSRATQDGSMDHAQAAALMQRSELHAGYIKRLHAFSEQARAIFMHGQNVLERRNALLAQLRIDFDGYEKVWLRRTYAIAQDARGRGSLNGVEGAAAAHEELVKRLGRSVDASQALQQEEQNFAQQLASLRTEIDRLSR